MTDKDHMSVRVNRLAGMVQLSHGLRMGLKIQGQNRSALSGIVCGRRQKGQFDD